MPEGTGMPAAAVGEGVDGSEGLGIVLDDIQAVGGGKVQYRGHVAALPEEMDGDDDPRPGSQRPLYEADIRVEGLPVHIHQYRP